MSTFPDDFLDGDGRFRAVVRPDSTPVIYITTNGSYVCAACVNTLRATPDDQDERDRSWNPVAYELLTHEPAVYCEYCSHGVEPLCGQDDTS